MSKKNTIMTLVFTMAVGVLVSIVPQIVFGHCQVPCGIYDDAARVSRLNEDAATIAKAIDQINALTGESDAQSANQTVRWVTTKESHAADIISTVSEYFLAQRVKPVAADADGYKAYLEKLAAHHAVVIAAMKAKQNADPVFAVRLQTAIDGIASYYNPEDHQH